MENVLNLMEDVNPSQVSVHHCITLQVLNLVTWCSDTPKTHYLRTLPEALMFINNNNVHKQRIEIKRNDRLSAAQ